MKGRRLKEITTQYRRLLIMIGLTLVLVIIGVAGFMYFEHLLLFDAIWMMIISIMTVGYGDIYPVTEQGRMFALFIVPAGAATISYGLGTVASYFIEKHFPEKVWEKRMQKELKKLSNHVIICGSGSIARQVHKQLKEENETIEVLFVSEMEDALQDALAPATLRIIDDPTDKQVLERARLHEARALIAAMEQDADNVFITLTAKNMNSQVEVSAISAKEDSEPILKKAGADYVINPAVIGGRELAMSVMRPSGAAYIHRLMSSNSDAFSVGEVEIDDRSKLLNQSIASLALHDQYNVQPVAISRNGQLISNPGGEHSLTKNDVLLFVGKRDDIEQLQQVFSTG